MTGERGVIFTVRNQSGQPCLLRGYPDVQLVSAEGTVLPFMYRRGGGPYVTHATPQTIRLDPGRASYLLIAKYRCDLGYRKGEVAARWIATRAIIQLPGEHSLHTAGAAYPVGAYAIAYCTRPADAPGNLVAVSPIERRITDLIGR